MKYSCEIKVRKKTLYEIGKCNVLAFHRYITWYLYVNFKFIKNFEKFMELLFGAGGRREGGFKKICKIVGGGGHPYPLWEALAYQGKVETHVLLTKNE